MDSKPTRFAYWLLGSLCAMAAVSCNSEKQDPDPNLVAVRYAQTQCADRWGQAQGTQQLITVAQTYLAQQGLTLHQPSASVKNAGMVCNACSCTTGLVLEGTVQSADLPAVLALGFNKQ
ncbi:hypothetical protein ACFP2F_14355 [Hymenobacter artigasi]|uniref:Lipoprotein n=1 Tax=Hymenobacter artigasi TaxID=2719616 RepID=A0ABX1HNV7_9BACT|nr:hypothetical protein [Hymenobacter artigasi]NKI90797.1 hypothetical protein [Hymenobacter artigasi]